MEPARAALVTLALAVSERDIECERLKAAERDARHELAAAQQHSRVLLMDNGRRARPYEGSLYRELRHAIRRWKSYR